tara:strand:- start:828 stop:1007 length:180 start_codon:yes stop_codon:yes gene_type:complete
MDPFDRVDITDNGEFISFNHGHSIPYEDAEEMYEAGIDFTTKAERELKIDSGAFFNNAS